MIQAHIYYSGTVQGVGFRYTVVRYAQPYDLKGWVKNLPDGRVELLAQGHEEKIKKFCEKIDQHFDGYISDKQETMTPPNQHFHDFKIVY